jgi:hypothetical protein
LASCYIASDQFIASNENLVFTSLKKKALEIHAINEFIIDVPEIDGATPRTHG